ncbi:carboxylesterase [Companilactobacillus mindensis DSM 14500]|uniref:Carboxylesterase n=1 Tax=Companilactobacillus mindensis DSM 14500 TaxID=1423770 RepID=A0A0R1QP15_9LACO|nr:alpha/beta hydrolase fold domain-containing protein [Companilactobacillus mindensis]KRL43778.1 carboxylesterase [Companilactobacillus mindensis DSM 14500]GEO79076.1 alpha/beta hydrolase [Companilactobacillus mindensis]
MKPISNVQISEFTVDTSVGSIKVIKHTPSDPQGMIINLNGGNFLCGPGLQDRQFCENLCLKTNFIVLEVIYPLAPKHPYPDALNASYEAIQILQHQFNSTLGRPVIIGHSSGGNLAVGTQILAQQNRQSKAKKLILDCPMLDLNTEPAKKDYPEDSEISPELSQKVIQAYLQNNEKSNPLVSPVFADEHSLVDFPPTAILTADLDVLRDEGKRFEELLSRHGIKVWYRNYHHATHGFIIIGGNRSKDAFADIIEQVKNN